MTPTGSGVYAELIAGLLRPGWVCLGDRAPPAALERQRDGGVERA